MMVMGGKGEGEGEGGQGGGGGGARGRGRGVYHIRDFVPHSQHEKNFAFQ